MEPALSIRARKSFPGMTPPIHWNQSPHLAGLIRGPRRHQDHVGEPQPAAGFETRCASCDAFALLSVRLKTPLLMTASK